MKCLTNNPEFTAPCNFWGGALVPAHLYKPATGYEQTFVIAGLKFASFNLGEHRTVINQRVLLCDSDIFTK